MHYVVYYNDTRVLDSQSTLEYVKSLISLKVAAEYDIHSFGNQLIWEEALWDEKGAPVLYTAKHFNIKIACIKQRP